MLFTVSVLVLLGLLPAMTYVLVGYALRPTGEIFAPLRLALVRAAVLVGGVAAVLVEVLGAARALTLPAVVASWAVATLLALLGAVLRVRRDRRSPGPLLRTPRRRWWAAPGDWLRAIWLAAGRAERIMAIALIVLFLAELLIALVSPPNNYDSQTYHLPRIEHWVQQRDVAMFATRIPRQVDMSPGAEYLLLHLRLLTGGDALYNLVQYAAGLTCALVASRIAGQLGGSARAQMIAAFVVGTTPMVALESTSTQTDLMVAAWTACVATLVLDELRRRTRLAEVALLGGATGLTALTKDNALLAAGPLLVIWGIAQLRLVVRRPAGPANGRSAQPSGPANGRSAQPSGPAEGPRRWRGWLPGLARIAAESVAILGVALVVTGPFLVRMDRTYGNPLGPDYLRNSVSTQRHDPAAVLVNALRIGHTALDTPIAPLNDLASNGIELVARGLHVDIDDPRITFLRTTFPVETWRPDEDKASMPVEGVLVLLGAGFMLVRPGRRVPGRHAGVTRVYAATFWLAMILYVATIKWQPWGNRLILYLLVLGAPLSGLWLDAVLRRGIRPRGSGNDARPEGSRDITGRELRAPVTPRPLPSHPVPAGQHVTAARWQGAGRWQAAGGPLAAGRWPAGDPDPAGDLSAEPAGLAAPRPRPAPGRRVAAWLTVVTLLLSGAAGWLSAGYGWPRRLVGSGSVFTISDTTALFQRRPQWQADYEWAAAAVRASGAKRVGLVQSDDTWEYPWWVLLPGRSIVAEQSLVPGIPYAAPDSVDAVICVATPSVCPSYVPKGWQLHKRGIIGYAVPPGK